MTVPVAVVVGSRGGIGQQVCHRFAADGYDIVELDRATGVGAGDPDAVETALRGVSAPAALVHVAGSVGSGGLEDHSLDDWHRVLDDNLTSAFVVCRALVPRMRQAGTGSIVLSSSVMGRQGGNSLSGPAYAVAKAGILGLVRYLAKDLAADGVRANAIAPGPVATPMVDRLTEEQLAKLMDTVPLNRVAAPAEIAGTIAFLCSAAAASITGAVVDINGGMWVG